VEPCSLVGGYPYRVPEIIVFVLSVVFNCPFYFSLSLSRIIRNSMYYQLQDNKNYKLGVTFKWQNIHTKFHQNPTMADMK
jgi:hypothetical protein